MSKQRVSLIYGYEMHYLDHLAPLSNHYQVPLITIDERIHDLCERFYPDVSCYLFDPLEIHNYIIKEVEEIIYCFTKAHFQSYFKLSQDLAGKNISTTWAPHGYSDKQNLEMAKEEEKILTYGPLLEERIRKYALFASLQRIGNVRLNYYQKYETFYQRLLEQIMAPLKKQPTFLFAPTWDDYEGLSSYHLLEKIAKNLPDDCNLIVKLHPNTCQRLDLKMEQLKGDLQKPNLFFADHLPFIYPLLDKVDGFIGDRSSIAYDFLYFDKPSFFLLQKNDPLLPIHQTGRVIKEADHLFTEIKSYLETDRKKYTSIRKKLYHKVFAL